MTAQQIIQAGLEKLTVIPLGGTASTAQLTAGLVDLNNMAKAWRKFGLTTWARASKTFNLVSGTASYTVGPSANVNIARPVRLLDAYYTRDGKDTPMTQIAKSDYFALTDKTTAGLPVQYWYDQETGTATLYLWPVPNESSLTMTFDYHVPLTAMVASDTLDVPDEWIEAYIFNLPLRQAPNYKRAASKELLKMAADTLALASGSNNEETSVRFEPEVWE